MHLVEIMDTYTQPTIGKTLEEAGPACRAIFGQFRDVERTRSYIATSYWQAYTQTHTFFIELDKMGFDPFLLDASRQIVVARAERRLFDLIVFLPGWSARPFIVDHRPPRNDLVQGWFSFVSRIVDTAPLLGVAGMAAVEALEMDQPFSAVVIGGLPPFPTAAPKPHWQVTGSIDSTAGVAAIDKSKRSGVTAALHAIGSATKVTVDGNPGTVVSTNVTTDSCFIETVTQNITGFPGQKGPLINMLPRGNQAAAFDGLVSGSKDTHIDSWDKGLPYISSYNQLHVYTPPVTNKGDSGAALVTDDDYVAGFAFERSPPVGAVVEFSSWIWAHSVYEQLSLEY